MKPSRLPLSLAGAPAGEALPLADIVPKAISKTVQREQVIAGMLAVGATLGEALRPFASVMSAEEAIGLVHEFAESGVERLRVLYEVQKDFEDKRAFGQACLKACFSPVGVALAGVVYGGDGYASGDLIQEIQSLIRAFGVDTWMANCLKTDWLHLGKGDIQRISAPIPVVACALNITEGRNRAEGVVVVPWLREAGDTVSVMRNADLPLLTRVSGNFEILDASLLAVAAPLLAEVGGALCVQHTRDICLPRLTKVGKDLMGFDSRDLNLPMLIEVGADIDLQRSKGVVLSLLSVVGEDLILSHAERCRLPILAKVGGSVVMNDASDGKLDSLVEVGIDVVLNRSKNIDFPVLQEVGRKIYSANSENLSAPCLESVNGVKWEGFS